MNKKYLKNLVMRFNAYLLDYPLIFFTHHPNTDTKGYQSDLAAITVYCKENYNSMLQGFSFRTHAYLYFDQYPKIKLQLKGYNTEACETLLNL